MVNYLCGYPKMKLLFLIITMFIPFYGYAQKPINCNEFWKIISHIDQKALVNQNDNKAVKPLVSLLSSKQENTIKQFHKCLSHYLYVIDGKKWAKETGKSGDSDDGFLYARSYVVAKGKEHYNKVVKNPALMPKNEEWAESLLYVAGQAWANVTKNNQDDFDAIVDAVSYETGSNTKQW